MRNDITTCDGQATATSDAVLQIAYAIGQCGLSRQPGRDGQRARYIALRYRSTLARHFELRVAWPDLHDLAQGI
ncbi:hypothetical protein MesoLj131b_77220 (plasmid) [Mesorhizobium sp. 131-2-5]|nr:hypothetical protein MesoLj131b_77220 [Mesorhizobium sp. 131-2-5]